MNISQSPSTGSENICKSRYVFITVPWRNSLVDSFYGLLVAAAVFGVATCPLTILLNALVMVAVKTKRRLQKNSNILLACMALTDLMVGLVVQPLYIAKTIFVLQDKEFHEFCDLDLAFSVCFLTLVLATGCHLVLISGERYLAIKHTFVHETVTTKARLMVCSAVAWIVALSSIPIVSYSTVRYIYVSEATILVIIVLLQFLVYKEARRHEKRILSQHVSVEARAKFKQEKKALKLTTIILVTLFLCFALPPTFMLITFGIFKAENSLPDVKAFVRHLVRLPVIFNSVLNPVIYSVRKREFRVAFIELLLRKSLHEADEFDKRLFGSSPNNAVRQQDRQEGEGRERNAEERNVAHADGNHEDNIETLACGANFDDNKTVARQNEPVSSSANNSTSKKAEEDHGDLRNLSQAKIDREVLAPAASFDWKSTDTALNEILSSNEDNSGEGPQLQIGARKAETVNIETVEELSYC